MKKILVTLVLLFTSTYAYAIPIDAESHVQANVQQIKSRYPQPAEVTTENQIQDLHVAATLTGNEPDSLYTGKALADLTTGQVKVYASISSAHESLSSSAHAVEFLTFDSDADISWAMDWDGTLTGSGTGNSTYFGTTALLADVTDMDSVFDDQGDFLDSVYDNLVSNFSDGFAAYSDDTANFPGSQFNRAFDGQPYSVASTTAYAASVEAGRLYALRLSADADVLANTPATVTNDFFNTASFRFTDLDGATFQSQSGEFLTAAGNTNDVPEPGNFGIGVLALLALLIANGRWSVKPVRCGVWRLRP